MALRKEKGRDRRGRQNVVSRSKQTILYVRKTKRNSSVCVCVKRIKKLKLKGMLGLSPPFEISFPAVPT